MKIVQRKPKLSKFLDYFKEATGFSCNLNFDIEGTLPYSSYYILFSKMFFQEAINSCNIPLSEKDVNETLTMIDDAMYDSSLIRGLRKAIEIQSPILYRDEEEPVKLNVEYVKNIKILTSFPIPSPKYVNNSLIHLLGVIPIDIINNIHLLSVENGLWSAIYNLPYPLVESWKWIWDLNWATLIQFSN
ncbi:hypothetical protein DFR86_05750 [Acidianus sulfidivorans JP7]|uniref:Uncharacterized protein n=1 Tax=Acidianus sulfidivorans JP7 TaxID=619593 RepID=A0A2U9IQJ5_9CREN|nr:hypothetical protein DFR86_05750 [Acidianus sulfidivorans JP7]